LRDVIITGGNSGLGLEIVKLHIALGDNVYSLDIEHTNSFDELIPKNLTLINVDLSEINSLPNLVELLQKTDVLYLNAAAATKESFPQKSEKQILNEIQLNVISNVLLIKHFLQKDKSNAKIVIISSSVRYFLSPELEIYAASKSFISTFIENLYDLTTLYNLSLYLFEPSGMQTNFQRNAGVKSVGNKLLDPMKVAKKIVSTVIAKRGFIVKRIGLVSHFTYFLRKFVPNKIYFKFINYLFKKYR
jgi:short-subunit dehydrogenase